MSMHVCKARWRESPSSEWQRGLAILREPGMSDVLLFVNRDGTPHQGEVWSFHIFWMVGNALSVGFE